MNHPPLIYTHPPRVEVLIKRKAEKVVLSRKQREGMKARDIYQKYPKLKADSLMKSLREKGLWYYDPDFEKDEEDPLLQSNQHKHEIVLQLTLQSFGTSSLKWPYPKHSKARVILDNQKQYYTSNIFRSICRRCTSTWAKGT